MPSPLAGPELIIGIEWFAHDIGLVVLVVPGIAEAPGGLADSPGVTLAAGFNIASHRRVSWG